MTHKLDQLQLYLLTIMVMLAPNTIRNVLWDTPALYQYIFVDFRSVQVFLFDFPMIVLLGVTLVRLLLDSVWRQQFIRMIPSIAGGRWWLRLALWMAISGLWALHPILSLYSAIRWLAALAVALVVADLTARGKWSTLVWVLLFSALLQSLIALAQWLSGGTIGLAALGEIPMQARPIGLTVNPNNLAGLLLIALGCGAWLAWEQRHETGQRGLIFVLVVIALALVSTRSRAALLGCLLASAYFMLRQQITWRRVQILGGLLLMLLVVTYKPGRQPAEYFQRMFYEAEDAVALIRQEPLLGVGAGNLMVRVDQMREDAVRRMRLPAHNTILVAWAELGLIGLALLALGVFAVLHQVNFILIGLAVLLSPVIMFDYYVWLDYRSHIILIYVLGMMWGNLYIQKTGVA